MDGVIMSSEGACSLHPMVSQVTIGADHCTDSLFDDAGSQISVKKLSSSPY